MEKAVAIPILAYFQFVGVRTEVKGVMLDRSGDWGIDFFDIYIEK